MSKTARNKIYVILISVGVALVVLLSFKYLLPYVWPFVAALVIAYIIDKPVTFFAEKFRLKRVVWSVFMIGVVFSALGVILWFLGRTLLSQIYRFMSNIDKYIVELDTLLCGCCDGIDSSFGMKCGTSYDFVSNGLAKTADTLSDTFFSKIMSGSMGAISWFTVAFTTVTITVMACVFLSRDMNDMRDAIERSIFADELQFIITRLRNILGVYVKTQIIIMTLTAIICTVGLYFLGNSYALMLGILIGIIDAFPILGTGTVFLPWTVLLVVFGNYKRAAAIFAIYLICYYTRQFLEPKLMGNGTGMKPVIMLLAVYAGLLLFGISGVITGPIAALLIKEISAHLIKKLVE